MLRDETPRCRCEALPADLADAAQRHALFTQLGASATRALVVTEGLPVYLAATQVIDLARDLHAVPSFRWWLCDLSNSRLLKMLRRQWGASLGEGNAPMQFAVDDPEGFFGPLGRRVARFRSAIVEAHRLRREMLLGWLTRLLIRISPPAKAEEVRRMSGFALLDRTDVAVRWPAVDWLHPTVKPR